MNMYRVEKSGLQSGINQGKEVSTKIFIQKGK